MYIQSTYICTYKSIIHMYIQNKRYFVISDTNFLFFLPKGTNLEQSVISRWKALKYFSDFTFLFILKTTIYRESVMNKREKVPAFRKFKPGRNNWLQTIKNLFWGRINNGNNNMTSCRNDDYNSYEHFFFSLIYLYHIRI